MMQDIFEQVEVDVVFGKRGIVPRLFIWKRRLHRVKNVTYVWHERKGEELIYYFSVTDGSTLYELSFHTKSLRWMLDRVYVEG